MKFLHLTDTHYKKNYENEGFERLFFQSHSPKKQLNQVLDEVNDKPIDFLVITGDLVHEGTSEDYMELDNIIKSKFSNDFKIFYCLGNHDNKSEFYKGVFNKDLGNKSYYYTEVVNGYRLIILDSAIKGNESGTFTTKQLEWLEKELKKDSEKGTLIFCHHPIIWNGDENDVHVVTNSKNILEILKNSDAIAIISGHTHHNSYCVKNGITQIVGDSTAFSLNRKKIDYISVDNKAGYNVIEVDNGVLKVHSEVLERNDILAEMLTKDYLKIMKSLDGNKNINTEEI